MMKKFVKLEEKYILRPPSKQFLAVVVVDSSNFPLSTEIDRALGKLKEMFDLFFIFDQRFNSSVVKKINWLKFTTLEGGIGFTGVENHGPGIEFFRVCEYLEKTLENKYKVVTITYLSELQNLDFFKVIAEVGKKFTTSLLSNLTSPVLEIIPHSPTERWEKYSVKEEEEIEEYIPTKTDIWTGAWCWTKDNLSHLEMNMEGAWNTYTSKTPLPYLPLPSILQLYSLFSEEWIESWKNEPGIIDMLASGIIQFKVNHLNRNILEVNINLPKNE